MRPVGAFLKRTAIWLSPPPRFCAALLSLAFVISLLSWAIGDRVYQSVLFFPQARGTALRGELRNLPRTSGREKTAELLASELLLGPASPDLASAFPVGVRVESTMLRRGVLYLDLSQDAALADPARLRIGLASMEKSLRAGLPGIGRIVITIGGIEPYKDGLAIPDETAKKSKKN
jgi:hypothetical protein